MTVGFNANGKHVEQVVDRVVVRDRFGQVVVVVLEVVDGAIFAARPHERGFNEALEMVGVRQDLVVDVRPAAPDSGGPVVRR